jgi:carbonic anhydrase
VIGCVDSRVDPSDVLGLKLGEAVVMRNVGGRVTPEALRSWALLGRLGAGQPASGGYLAILHHTDCGIRRLASYPEQLAAFFEIPAADLGSKAVEDPYASVRIDVEIARHRLPGLLVSGLVYDVDTGLIEFVVPATTEQRRV